MASAHDALELTAQCLCKAQTITASVPTSSLPLEATYCHCTSCRHITGGLHESTVPWPGPPAAIQALSLREYARSPSVTLLFCGTCSSPLFWREQFPGKDGQRGEPEFQVFTGALSNNAVPGMVRIRHHSFVGDTLDGGAAVWFQHDASGTRIPCYRAGSHSGELVDPAAMASAKRAEIKDVAAPDEIPLYCHCKGVNLVLRPRAVDFSAPEASEPPFFVEPSTYKLLASFDACNSCRSSAGIDIINWTFALLKCIDYAPSASDSSLSSSSFPDSTVDLRAAVDSPDRDPRLSHLAYYASSADVQRYFCSRCSAPVFYAVDDRPDMVDVSVGLLDAPDGARADNVLAWALGLMSWPDDVKGGWREELADTTKRNVEDWRVKSGIPISWIRKRKEEKDAEKAAPA